MLTLLAALILNQAQAAEVVIPKSQFLDGMKSGLPEKFCADTAYFRKCFTIKPDDCAKEANADYAACAEKLQGSMPDSFHQPADGQKWGQQVGICVGTKFEQNQAKAKLKSADCSNADKWSKANP